MIVLDTHIWVWWVHGDPQLKSRYVEFIQANLSQGLGVSVISCWEVAKLVEYDRLILPCALEEWMERALDYPEIYLLDLTPQICIDSTQLPGAFHRDPADQLIVATARTYDWLLVTMDNTIQRYPYFKTLEPKQ
jgi:PIN domain nuclease of toxin-antitoxin system